MALCIPIIGGCHEKLNITDPDPHLCPRCNNPSLNNGSARRWFEVCFVPLIPMKKKHIVICHICNWRVQKPQDGQQGPPNGQFQNLPPPTGKSGNGTNPSMQSPANYTVTPPPKAQR